MNKVKRKLRFLSSNTAKLVLRYFGILLFFAFVYWCMFLYDSTSFFISEQFNKHVERYYLFDPDIDLASYHSDIKDGIPISMNEFNALIKPEFDKLSSINESIEGIHHHLNNCISKLDSLAAIADKKRSDSVKIFKMNEFSSYQQKIDSLKEYIGERDSTQMIIDGKYVELAQIEYEYAKINAKVCSYVLEKRGSFIPDSLMKELTNENEERIRLSEEIETQENTRRIVSNRIKEISSLFHINRLESVTFWDFVYYSVCVGTTTSFGDIAPNNAWTRLITIVELLICMIFVAKIVCKFQDNNRI